MENNSDHLLERDAAPISARSLEIVESFSENRALVEANNRTVNNNMVLSNQQNHSSVINFSNSSGITLGSVFNIGWSPGNAGVVAEPNISSIVRARDSVYKKTPTIKKMLDSRELISSAFLDIVSGYFGARWKEVTILLQINQLFVERMYEDFNDKGGTKEVVFQILTKYFKDHEEKSTVGWFITFLWRNGFKETVWTVKEPWKDLQELEKDLED